MHQAPWNCRPGGYGWWICGPHEDDLATKVLSCLLIAFIDNAVCTRRPGGYGALPFGPQEDDLTTRVLSSLLSSIPLSIRQCVPAVRVVMDVALWGAGGRPHDEVYPVYLIPSSVDLPSGWLWTFEPYKNDPCSWLSEFLFVSVLTRVVCPVGRRRTTSRRGYHHRVYLIPSSRRQLQ
jgi:hypothetical protein